jgi:hypothetical protein
MNIQTVIKVLGREHILFTGGYELYSTHERDCCEDHWVDFSESDDIIGLKVDLDSDFVNKIEGYGIEIIPVEGTSHPVRVPGYGGNNGYYSSNLTLNLSLGNKVVKEWDLIEG